MIGTVLTLRFFMYIIEFIVSTSFIVFMAITDKYIPNKKIIIYSLVTIQVITIYLMISNIYYNTYKLSYPRYYDFNTVVDYFKEV